MARITRSSTLETRTARIKLPRGKYHWKGIRQGLAIGYRKVRSGGTWTVRLMTGPDRYITRVLGVADDHQDANGIDVLDYGHAQERARAFAGLRAKDGGMGPYTVREAVADYLEWFAANRKSLQNTRNALHAHVLPVFGPRLVSELTTRDVRGWLHRLAASPARFRSTPGRLNARPSTERARKVTANRIMNVFKAALNYAWREGRVPSDDAWRKVKPFRGVESVRIQFFSQDECTRLVNACASDFRLLVQGALYSGCRYGELGRLRVKDYYPDAVSLFIAEAKSGHPRYIPLTEAGRLFIERQTAGRAGDDYLFVRGDGQPWGRAHQTRPMREACDRARITPPVGFHVLRHTYGSALAMRGVPLQVIAAALGHSDTRITSKHYAHLMPCYIADVVRANLPDLGGHVADNVVSFQRWAMTSDKSWHRFSSTS